MAPSFLKHHIFLIKGNDFFCNFLVTIQDFFPDVSTLHVGDVFCFDLCIVYLNCIRQDNGIFGVIMDDNCVT